MAYSVEADMLSNMSGRAGHESPHGTKWEVGLPRLYVRQVPYLNLREVIWKL